MSKIVYAPDKTATIPDAIVQANTYLRRHLPKAKDIAITLEFATLKGPRGRIITTAVYKVAIRMKDDQGHEEVYRAYATEPQDIADRALEAVSRGVPDEDTYPIFGDMRITTY